MMSKDGSMSSGFTYSLSNININSRNFNPAASIPSYIVEQLKRDGDTFQRCRDFSERLWKELRKNDLYSKGEISYNALQNLWPQLGEQFQSLTKIKSAKEMLEVFDLDKDGYLNEDEQLLIFSFVKERMYETAQNLLKIQSYQLFKVLMRDVRAMEHLICNWQLDLRKKIHKTQLDSYASIGDHRVDQFCIRYELEFRRLDEVKQDRLAKLQANFRKELAQFNQALNSRGGLLKFKPKHKLFELQVQQKLVSLEERVEEALDFRKELREMQKYEAQRLQKQIAEYTHRGRQKIQQKYSRERQQLELVLQQMQHKLLIKMRKEYNVTLKKNHLHENEIKRIQSSETNWAGKDGIFKPELQRTKLLERRRNQILQETKALTARKVTSNTFETKEGGNTKTRSVKVALRNMVKRGKLFNYQLRTKTESELPINVRRRESSKASIEKYLRLQKKETALMPSLCRLYTEELGQAESGTITEHLEQSRRKEELVTQMLSKLNIHSSK